MAARTKVLIMGAAGRDFHNFNTYFRERQEYEIVAFTATQIPYINDRKYPAVLAGKLYPDGISIYDESEFPALVKKYDADILMNLCAPNFNPPLLQAALKAQVHYLDTAMTLSEPHPTDPMHKCGKKLGDDEYALSPEFEKIGKYALAGFGVEPGMADYFARYAADHLFDEIDEIGIRDGSNLDIPGAKGISFGFSV